MPRQGADNVEGLPADRAGGTEDYDALRHYIYILLQTERRSYWRGKIKDEKS
jgi:hypothetical protein